MHFHNEVCLPSLVRSGNQTPLPSNSSPFVPCKHTRSQPCEKHLLILFKDNYTEIKDQIKIRDVIDQKGGERSQNQLSRHFRPMCQYLQYMTVFLDDYRCTQTLS